MLKFQGNGREECKGDYSCFKGRKVNIEEREFGKESQVKE